MAYLFVLRLRPEDVILTATLQRFPITLVYFLTNSQVIFAVNETCKYCSIMYWSLCCAKTQFQCHGKCVKGAVVDLEMT